MGANTYLTGMVRQVLESARVGIAGAGGLGSNCAAHLVRAGMKKLVIADFDVVNESNLNRQFFFRNQLGQKKVVALGRNLRLIELALDLTLHEVKITPDNARNIFALCDIVVEAFDSAEQKSMLLSALLPTGRHVVSASGLAGWGRSNDIQVKRVGRNLILVGDERSDIRTGLAPVSPRVGIAAAMQANAVVSLLLGEEI